MFAALDLKGRGRLIEATGRRATADFARFVRRVVDELCASASGSGPCSTTSAPTRRPRPTRRHLREAYRLAQILELHFIPRHGSWLDAVDLELSAARSQCLARRFASLEELRREMRAWQDECNQKEARVRWTFDVPSARKKLTRIYSANKP